MPTWIKKFHSHRLKILFQQVLEENLPAHLAVNYLWLSPKEMAIFEDVYFDWKGAFQNQKAQMEIDEQSKKLLDLILHLKEK